jgi:predicted DNA-binding protein
VNVDLVASATMFVAVLDKSYFFSKEAVEEYIPEIRDTNKTKSMLRRINKFAQHKQTKAVLWYYRTSIWKLLC